MCHGVTTKTKLAELTNSDLAASQLSQRLKAQSSTEPGAVQLDGDFDGVGLRQTGNGAGLLQSNSLFANLFKSIAQIAKRLFRWCEILFNETVQDKTEFGTGLTTDGRDSKRKPTLRILRSRNTFVTKNRGHNSLQRIQRVMRSLRVVAITRGIFGDQNVGDFANSQAAALEMAVTANVAPASASTREVAFRRFFSLLDTEHEVDFFAIHCQIQN